MAKQVLNHLGMDRGKQHQTGRGGAQVVNTKVRQTGILEGAVQDLSRLSDVASADRALEQRFQSGKRPERREAF